MLTDDEPNIFCMQERKYEMKDVQYVQQLLSTQLQSDLIMLTTELLTGIILLHKGVVRSSCETERV